MAEKHGIVGNLRGAETMLREARDGIQRLYEEGEVILGEDDLMAVDAVIDNGRKLINEINLTANIYREIVKMRNGNGAPKKNATGRD